MVTRLGLGKAGKVLGRPAIAKTGINAVTPQFRLQPSGRDRPAPGKIIQMQQHMRRQIPRWPVTHSRPVQQQPAQTPLCRQNICGSVTGQGARLLDTTRPFIGNQASQ